MKGYDEEIKAAWVNIREEMYVEQLEEMYAETKNKKENFANILWQRKANVKPSISPQYTHVPSRMIVLGETST